MLYKGIFFVFSILFTLIVSTSADTLTPKTQSKLRPGKYILDNGNGELLIRLDKQGELTFSIVTVGANCSTCDLSGIISGTIGYMDSWEEDGKKSKCEISFTANHSAVNVQSLTYDECRGFCGFRAGFNGIYSIPPKECTEAGKQKIHDQFLALYRSHNYTLAVSILQNQLQQCLSFINWIEIDEVRNDLALAQYHNGEVQQCLITLNKTLVAKVKDEQELKEGYLSTCDFDSYIHVAKSTWFNKELCTKAISKRR